MNKFFIKGRLTRDPEIRQTQSGVSVCKFTVAVDRKFSRQGEEKQTDFVDCVAWRGLGDMVGKYCHKGKEIIVCGENHSRKWQDKDGNNRVSWELNADEVYFCGSKGDSSNSGYTPAQAAPAANTEGFAPLDEEDGELPF